MLKQCLIMIIVNLSSIEMNVPYVNIMMQTQGAYGIRNTSFAQLENVQFFLFHESIYAQ